MTRWITAICFLALITESRANVCTSNDGLWQGGAAKTTVDVYYSIHPTEGLAVATEMGYGDIATAVLRTINIINEESGASVRLRFRGATNSTSDIAGGIVLKSVDCYTGADNAIAQTVISEDGSGVAYKGHISIFDFSHRLNPGDPCGSTDIHWGAIEGSPGGLTDLVQVLLHEFGHGVFNFGHVGQADQYSINCPDFGQLSIMRPDAGTPRPWVLKDLDIEGMQERYGGARGQWSSVYRSYRWSSSSWQTPFTAGTPFSAASIAYRFGSMPQDVRERNMGFVITSSNSTVLVGGAGTIATWQYPPGAAPMHILSSTGMMRPSAIAKKPGTSELILVYEVRAAATYMTNSDVGYLCFRTTTDNAATWSTEQCVSQVYRNGLTVNYDAYSDTFIVGYISTNDDLAFYTIPAVGSTTPANNTVPQGAWQSWHAPSIACPGFGNCLMAFEAHDNTTRVFTKRISVSRSTGNVILGLTVFDSLSVASFDTPSLSYNPYDQKYIMAITQGNENIYIYETAAGGTSWTGAGSLAFGSYISTAVLALRTLWAGNNRAQVWFLKYW